MSLGRLVALSAILVGACARVAPIQAPPTAIPLPPPVVVPTPDSANRADSAQLANAAAAAQDTAAAVQVSEKNLDSAAAALVAATAAQAAAAAAAAATTVGVQAAIEAPAPEPAQIFPMLSLDPYASHDRVEHYLKLFSGSAKSRMGLRLSAGTRYASMIREKLRAGGIPEDLTYLALIESGYDPHAYSVAAAVGMWQFMSSTARASGLRVDWWIDERRDPVRATDAAIRHFNELRGRFGSIYLAAAAYNGGGGRVSRGLSRLAKESEDAEPEDRFFTLASTNALRPETRNYVPQLIAAAIIGRDPLAYGITVDTLADYAFDSVSVPRATALSAVAIACNTELAEIRDLNGQVLRGMTPPDGAEVWLRIPSGCGANFDAGFTAIDSAARRGAHVHTAKKGETLVSVAKKAGTTSTVLKRYNPKIKSTTLTAGQKVLVPTKDAIRASREVPDPAIERWGTASGGNYVVRRGDTLGGIAQRNNTTVAALKRLNGLRSERIVAGQRLRVGR